VRSLETAVEATMASLDRYFARAAETPPEPPPASIQTDGDGLAAAAQLDHLLAEYSGDAIDYFESVRARLAGVLDGQRLAHLAQHLSRYEFEEARQLLATRPATASTS
jgi:hypothetical protein